MNAPLLLQHNAEYDVLVDQMGLLIPVSDLNWLLEKIAAHQKHSELELEAIARRQVQKNCPHMENQINWEYFR